MRTKTFLLILLLGVATALLTACNIGNIGRFENVAGSGNVVSEDREVSGFTAIDMQTVGMLVVEHDESEALRITADDNFLPYLETVVQGDTLIIRTTENVTFSDFTQLSFHISAITLEEVKLSGAASVEITGVDTEQWTASLTGAGSLTASGRATNQTIEISGAGNYDGAELQSRHATVNSSGAGAVVVQVSDTLDVTIGGIGSVQYIGDPTITQEIDGLGTVTKRE